MLAADDCEEGDLLALPPHQVTQRQAPAQDGRVPLHREHQQRVGRRQPMVREW